MSNNQPYAGVHLESNVMVPMRDGVRLATDIYYPAKDDGARQKGAWPAVLVRTSCNKTLSEWEGVPPHYTSNGYVFILQDLRSRHKSEGDGRYYHTCNPWEGDDGYDTVEWIAAQPWCNDIVGMIGSSHRAIVQTQAALHRPPHLAAICPEQGPTNIYLHEAREGGAMALHMYTAIYNHALEAQEIRDNKDAVRSMAVGLLDASKWLQKMPFVPGEIPLSAAPHLEETFFNYYYRGEYDEWWSQECNDQTPYWDRHADIPCFITGGWFDPFIDASTGYFEAMRTRNEKPSRLTIGPWGHGTMRRDTTALGDVEFGPDAKWAYPKHSEIRVRWFDRWLKGEINGVDHDAPVEIFVMGGGSGRKTPSGLLDHGGHWRTEQEWPIARTKSRIMYMTPDLGLTERAPAPKTDSLTFRFDPKHPVPTAGGSMAHLCEILEPERGLDYVPDFGDRDKYYGNHGRQIVPWGPIDQVESEWMIGIGAPYRPLANRPDVLSFQTDPLEEDMEITGQVRIKLWVSSSATDTDFTAKLVDVYPANDDYPNGYAMNLSDTVLRMRYRNSWTRPEMMEAGEIYPIGIVLPCTSNLFQKHHRIRVDISSSNFPRLDVNPNTGEPVGRHTQMVSADNTVYLDAERPSHIVIPHIAL